MSAQDGFCVQAYSPDNPTQAASDAVVALLPDAGPPDDGEPAS